MRTIVLIALLLGCVGTAGAACSGRQQAEPATYGEAAAQAFAEAERAYGRKDYELARSRFSEVFQSYPFSQYAATAEFRIGDCYLAERLYVRAIEVYRRFVRIHPTNELVAEAQGLEPLVQLLELVEMAVEEQELKELRQPQCQLQQQEP